MLITSLIIPLKYLFKLPGLNYIAEKVDSIFNPKRHIHRYLNIDGNVENFQREVRRHSQPLMYAAMGVIVNGLNPNCRTGMVNP